MTFAVAFFNITKIKMSSICNRLLLNAQKTSQLLDTVKKDVTHVDAKVKKIYIDHLTAENRRLKAEIERTRQQLIQLEMNNGVSLVNKLPGVETDPPIKEVKKESKVAAGVKKEKCPKPPKEKTATEPKPSKGQDDGPIDVGRLDIRVGQIKEVTKHPDADSLYVEKIDVGETNPRTVISGLVKFVAKEELENSHVLVLCNLKPAKMRGILSEGMLLCASTADKVEVLRPPNGSVAGDLIHCESFNRNPDAQLNPKKKIFETCAVDLKTNDELIACYKGVPLQVPGKGVVKTQTLPNVNIK